MIDPLPSVPQALGKGLIKCIIVANCWCACATYGIQADNSLLASILPLASDGGGAKFKMATQTIKLSEALRMEGHKECLK